MAKPIQFVWELETEASAEAVWALFGDTDRYNRAVGFDFKFTEEPRPDGTVKRIGKSSVLGFLDSSWEERPFRYRVPEWFESTRLFEDPLVERLVTSLVITDLGDRRGIRYVIEVTPRNSMARAIYAIGFKQTARPKIDAVIRVMLARLAGEDTRYDPLPEPLSTQAEEKLLSLVARIPPPTGERLASYLREAPLQQQAQIHPLRLARSWAVPEDRLLDGLLSAVREGMLELRLDLLCPNCRGSKNSARSLAELTGTVHCPSCNIIYGGNFPDSIVVCFRPVADLRELDIKVECLGSPYRQPHVLAQDRLETSGSRVIELTLTPGAYRIRTLPGTHSASLIVREGVSEEPPTLRFQQDKLHPSRLLAAPGKLRLTVDNYSGRTVEVLVEDRTLPEAVLTLGRLLERPRAGELLPPQATLPGLQVLTHQGAVLALEALDGDLQRAAEVDGEAQPRVLSVAPQGLVAVWPEFATTLQVARQLSRNPNIQLAVNTGPVTEVGLGESTVPMGSTVEAALAALVGASENHAAIPVERADSPEVRAALDVNTRLVRVDFGLSSGVIVHWIEFC